MPEDDSHINIRRLEEIVTLIITKVEDPKNRNLSYFGWDDRYDIHGRKGTIFGIVTESHILHDLGLKGDSWNITYRFFGFDELLSLYPYARCMLDILEAYRHSDNVQHITEQIKDLQNALSLANQQMKDAEHNTYHKVLSCIKR